MKPKMRVGLSLLGLLVGLVLITAAVRALPPSPGDQLATARRFEELLVLMDELGLDGWHDCPTCQPIDIRPGASPAPLPSGTTAFGTLKAATAGIVPSGRLVEISTVASPDEVGGRVVRFTSVARSMLGGETGHDLWVWTWYEEPQGSPTPGWISPSWDFQAVGAPDND